MLRPFKFFKQRRDLIVVSSGAKTQCARRHLKSSGRLRLTRLGQPEIEQVVDNDLERLAAAADLLLEEYGDVVVDGEKVVRTS